MLHLNVQSITNKVDELNLLLDSNQIDILCLSEHWLPFNKLEKIKLKNYNLISSFCRKDKERGGVAIFAANIIRLKPINISRFCIPQHAEFCGAIIPNTNCVLITIYRSSSNGDMLIFKEQLFTLIDHLFNKYKNCILLGDINLDMESNTEHVKDIKHFFNMYGLIHYIKSPTRVTATSSSCLDNIITNLNPDDLETGVYQSHIADHSGVFVNVKNLNDLCKNSALNKKSKRIINDNRVTKFANNLSNLDWSMFSNPNLNSNELTDVLIKNLCTQRDICFPTQILKIKKQGVKWFNERLRLMRTELRQSYCKFKTSNLPQDWHMYCDFRKSYKRAIKEEKRNAYANIIESAENKNKVVWNIVNKELPSKKKKTSTNLKPDELNTFFTTISDIITQTIPIENMEPEYFLNKIPRRPMSFFMPPIIESDMRAAILKLKNSACLDYYGLNSRLMKGALESLIEPLTYIINNCVAEGKWPNILKISKIIPIHKKGDTDVPDNFRPIAIVPIISKIFEQIIKEKLLSYLESKSILTQFQYGFRKNCSTVTALLEIMDTIVEGLDEGQSTHALMCDLTKAFDCVNVQTLLLKLEHYGIRGNILDLLESYLTGRMQFVSLNDVDSNLLSIRNGVPQGSVLGPILFLLYVNDLPMSLGSVNSILFADDTTLLSKNGEYLKQEGLNLAKTWFNCNNLKLNETKTQSIEFTSDKWAIKMEPVRMLGITFNASLNWTHHIDELCGKLSSQIFAIRQLKTCLDTKTIRMVYFAMVHSVLSYGILLWGNSPKAIKVFHIQKAAIRIIDAAPYGTHCRPLFAKHSIMPVACIYILETLLYVHKNSDKFLTHSDIHCRDTRYRQNLVVPFSRIKTTQVNKIDVNLYNKFINLHRSKDVKGMSLKSFKNMAKEFLLKNCFYSVKEFCDYSVSVNP